MNTLRGIEWKKYEVRITDAPRTHESTLKHNMLSHSIEVLVKPLGNPNHDRALRCAHATAQSGVSIDQWLKG